MKKAAIAMLIASSLGLSACQQQAVDPLQVETAQLENDNQKQSYAMGANLGMFIEQRMQEQESVGVELDKGLIVKGFIAALQGQAQMEREEVVELTRAVEQKIREGKALIDQQQAEQNKTDGAAYLAENAKREGVTVTESGLQYEVLTAGEGVKPTAQDTVKVHYEGKLLDGTVFDSSYARGEPAVFPLHRVIKGWTEGVQLMNEGSKFKFHIPAELAYGERSTGKITPNSTLVFDVELLEVVRSEASE